MMIYFGELLVMTLLGSVASLFLKRASGEAGIIAMLKNINLYVGGFLYLLSAVINIWVLKWLDYSVVLPLTSLTYIWTMVLHWRRCGRAGGRQTIKNLIRLPKANEFRFLGRSLNEEKRTSI